MSSAVKAVRYLLAHDPTLTAVVPSERIAAGRLGPKTTLPAVTIAHISTTRRAVVTKGITEFCTSRVQVTVHAKTYPDQDIVQRLVRKALPPTRGLVNGVDVDSIQPGGTGPDIIDSAADIYMGTDDFIVTFNE
jgi:hypothetical protein